MRRLLLALVLLAPSTASAVWNHPREIIHGTAHTLEKGELIVGVITPLLYGVNDDLTLTTHPILVALLTPNGGVRLKLFEDELVTFSAAVRGAGTIFGDDAPIPNDDRPHGHVYAGFNTTFDVGRGVLLSISAGYQHEFEQRIEDGSRADDDAVVFGLGIDFLAAANHLFVLTVGSQYSTLNSKLEATSGTFMYAYAFDSGARLGLGLAFGKFPVAVDEEDTVEIPLWPLVDWWARF